MANGSLYSFLLSDKLSRENPYDFHFDPVRVFFFPLYFREKQKTTDKLGFFDVLIALKNGARFVHFDPIQFFEGVLVQTRPDEGACR